MTLLQAREAALEAIRERLAGVSPPIPAFASQALRRKRVVGHDGPIDAAECKRLSVQTPSVQVAVMGRVPERGGQPAGVRVAAWVIARSWQPPRPRQPGEADVCADDTLAIASEVEEALRTLPRATDGPLLEVRAQCLYDPALMSAGGVTLWALSAVLPDAAVLEAPAGRRLPQGPLQAANEALAPAIDAALGCYGEPERRGMTERDRQLLALGRHGLPYCTVEHGAGEVRPAEAGVARWLDADGVVWTQDVRGLLVWPAAVRVWAHSLAEADAVVARLSARLPRDLTYLGQQYHVPIERAAAPEPEAGLITAGVELRLQAVVPYGAARRLPLLRRPDQWAPPRGVEVTVAMGAARGDDATLEVTWQAPARDTPTGYEVRYRAGGAWTTDAPPLTAEARSRRLTVAPGRQWHAAVRARHGRQASPWVVAQRVVTDAGDLPAVTIDRGATAPAGLEVFMGRGGNGYAAWEPAAPLTPAPRYVVQWKAAGQEYDPARELRTGELHARLASLAPGEYTFRVGASWDSGAPVWGAEEETMEITNG